VNQQRPGEDGVKAIFRFPPAKGVINAGEMVFRLSASNQFDWQRNGDLMAPWRQASHAASALPTGRDRAA